MFSGPEFLPPRRGVREGKPVPEKFQGAEGRRLRRGDLRQLKKDTNGGVAATKPRHSVAATTSAQRGHHSGVVATAL